MSTSASRLASCPVYHCPVYHSLTQSKCYLMSRLLPFLFPSVTSLLRELGQLMALCRVLTIHQGTINQANIKPWTDGHAAWRGLVTLRLYRVDWGIRSGSRWGHSDTVKLDCRSGSVCGTWMWRDISRQEFRQALNQNFFHYGAQNRSHSKRHRKKWEIHISLQGVILHQTGLFSGLYWMCLKYSTAHNQSQQTYDFWDDSYSIWTLLFSIII